MVEVVMPQTVVAITMVVTIVELNANGSITLATMFMCNSGSSDRGQYRESYHRRAGLSWWQYLMPLVCIVFVLFVFRTVGFQNCPNIQKWNFLFSNKRPTHLDSVKENKSRSSLRYFGLVALVARTWPCCAIHPASSVVKHATDKGPSEEKKESYLRRLARPKHYDGQQYLLQLHPK